MSSRLLSSGTLADGMADVEFNGNAPKNSVRKRELEAQIQALQLFLCFLHVFYLSTCMLYTYKTAVAITL